MRRFTVLIPAVLCLLLLSPFHATAAEPAVTLVYASHLANIQQREAAGGLAELSTLVRSLRAERPNVILFFGGNALGPSPLSSFDKGAHMIGLLNLLEPTLMAAGRRDFMHKEDELALRGREAVFPIICSNVTDPLTGEEPSGLFRDISAEEGDAVVGFGALVSPEIRTSYLQERVRVEGGYELLPDIASSLREQGAGMVIVSGDFKPDAPEKLLAESGVDILIYSTGSGDSSFTRYGDALFAVHGKESDVLLIEFAQREGVPGGLTVANTEVLKLGDYAADPDIVAPIAEYAGSLEALMNIPVGVLTTPVDTTTKLLRTQENALGNLVTDAMRDYYGSTIAVINSGGLRGNQTYPAGTTLTRRDLQSEMPLHDMSCLIDATGAELLAALEHAVDSVETARGKFLQVSGLHYSYNPAAAPGSRIRSVTVDGRPLEPEKTYSLTLPAYLAGGGDGFTMFGGSCRTDTPRPPQELVELVRAYINSRGSVAPKTEGRITIAQ
ncbi:bifunctional metallophosphatase/5'-nucleotidase [Desulfovibrio sp. OttesenSCG-928-I05]|nr:bifunctional metallophosphatase/5'-nucleotidase [Desulfovibrio sp. OttesenSCG-928-I05]